MELKNLQQDFKGTSWKHEIDVRDFIQHNYEPYDGDESFLAPASEKTKKLWDKLTEMFKIEREKGVYDAETKLPQSIDTYGKIIIVEKLEEAIEIANMKAPEHLELAMDKGAARDKIAKAVHNFGSLFIGHYSAEVLGDYAAGLNHTLPTSGAAHYTGGLSVRNFLKTVTTLRAEKGKPGTLKSSAAAGYLGDSEGLAGHARAARIRGEK